MCPFDPEHLVRALARFPQAPRLWVAFSGGLDSTCLLAAAVAVAKRLPGPLAAVHLDHGLQPDSGRWAVHCRALCRGLGVPFVARRLAIRPTPGKSLEALARQARYAALAELLGPDELMLTAHHQDDQAETLLLALLRGSGPEGLAAMPLVSDLGPGHLVRPLLAVPRAALEAYARDQGLNWVEDPSNDCVSLDRNYLRRRVLPLLRERWPAAATTLARSAAHCAEAAALIAEAANETLLGLSGRRPGTLSVSALAKLEAPQARAALRLWLKRQGFPRPDTAHLGRILSEVLPARVDADPLVGWTGCEIRRYRGDLFALAPLPQPPAGLVLDWEDPVLSLPPPLGTLERLGSWGAMEALGPLQVRFGVEGLSCRPSGGGHCRSLKRLFQGAGIPPWLRPSVPLVFAEDRLIAVAGVCACHGHAGRQSDGMAIRWIGHPWEALACFR